jgi:hypothetical protein
MKRILQYFFVICLINAGLLLAGRSPSVGFAAAASPGTTPLCGQINTSVTWMAANSPYEVCASGVTVMPGVTLTIEPGVTVQFAASPTNKLNVSGVLVADGTLDSPITFTGVSAAQWGGISIDGTLATPAQASLTFVNLEYGGVNGSFGAQVYADHASLVIDHSQVVSGAGSGLYLTYNTHFDVHNTSFTNNGLDAIRINTPRVDLLMTALSASGNGADVVHIEGPTAWPGQHRWTYPGIPYLVDGGVGNLPGDSLTIDAGSQLIFTPGNALGIGGELKALGTPDAPILMTGQTQTPGSWRGIEIFGGNNQAVVQLDYVTVEYAGSENANIEIMNGTLIADHSLIRNSQKDGVLLDSNAGASIRNSQITGNLLYGIRNSPSNRAVLAANNWWGDPNGPTSDLPACSAGTGDKVTAGVLFRPVLSDVNITAPFPLSSAPTLELSPLRWFAPADGIARIYFDITLRDGNGLPIPGRTVRLNTTLGTVTDGGITDARGKTLAYLTSASTGDADVSATLDPISSCEVALSPTAKVTFTQPLVFTELMPDGSAPYLNGDISVSPLPVVTGVNTTIYVRLTNPLTVPVTADVEIGFAQAGIGLAFGPIKNVTAQVIPASSNVTLLASWVPSVAGHYCIQVTYDITAVGPSLVMRPEYLGKQLKWYNVNAQPSKTGPPQKDSGLQKTRDSLKNMNRFVSRAYKTGHIAIPLQLANQGIEWDLNTADIIDKALKGDPARQDYTLIDPPLVLMLPPIQPGGGVSAARAAALNELDAALAQANAYGKAAATALDRYGGASEAGDLQWASTQSAAMLQYEQMIGSELITASLKIDNVINVAASEGVTSVMITASDVISMQLELASGFTPEEIADAHAVGLSDADIESIRQGILSANPNDLAGDLVLKMQAIRDEFNSLGDILLHPYVFNPGYSVTGSAGLIAQPLSTGNSMAQVYDSETTFQLRNPLTQTATINLIARRINLPADWGVVVSPIQVSLAPGETITVTVSMIAGAPLPQESKPSLAVEGYTSGQFLGGVTFDILVPRYEIFDGKMHLYMPLILR